LFVKEFSSTRQELFQKALHLFEKVLDVFEQLFSARIMENST